MYYFTSKDQLLLEAVRAGEDGFYAEVVAELGSIGSARDRLLRLIDLWSPPGDARRAAGGVGPLARPLGQIAARSGSWPRSARRRIAAGSNSSRASCARDGAPASSHATDATAFAHQLAAFMDGLALRVMAGDSRRDRRCHAGLVHGLRGPTPGILSEGRVRPP